MLWERERERQISRHKTKEAKYLQTYKDQVSFWATNWLMCPQGRAELC